MIFSAYKKIIEILDCLNIKYTIHNHEKVFTVNDVSSKLDIDIEKAYKTLVFKLEKNYVFAILKATDKIDYKNLALALETKREKIKSVSIEEIETDLGYELGGISPIPVKDNIIVVIDISILKEKEIFCGVGENDKSLEIESSDLLKVIKAKIFKISKKEIN